MSKVLIVGLGDVGHHLLEFLVRDPKCPDIVIGDISDEKELVVNNALIGAAVNRLYPSVKFKKIDLTDVNSTSKLIQEEKPDVIINCAVMHTWHLIRKLPEDIYAKISSATLGAWLPCQVALAYKLMEAIKKSGIKANVINTSLSCMVNPILAKAGLAPTIGIGNVELIQPAVRHMVSRKLQIPIDLVKVYLVAHHVWWVYPREAGYKKSPYYIKIYANDTDVTEKFNTDELMWDAIKLYPPGIEFTTVSASSTIQNMYALLGEQKVFRHSPGPNGLPGGYPISLSKAGAELALPEGITEEEAVKLMQEAQKLDGIERIEDDGTVIVPKYANKIMKEMLGFDHPTFKGEECYDLAVELIAKYKKFASKYI